MIYDCSAKREWRRRPRRRTLYSIATTLPRRRGAVATSASRYPLPSTHYHLPTVSLAKRKGFRFSLGISTQRSQRFRKVRKGFSEFTICDFSIYDCVRSWCGEISSREARSGDAASASRTVRQHTTLPRRRGAVATSASRYPLPSTNYPLLSSRSGKDSASPLLCLPRLISTLNPQHSTLNPQHSTLNPQRIKSQIINRSIVNLYPLPSTNYQLFIANKNGSRSCCSATRFLLQTSVNRSSLRCLYNL